MGVVLLLGEDESDLSDEHDVSLQTSHVNSDNRSVYSMLLTPQSPLATSNIKVWCYHYYYYNIYIFLILEFSMFRKVQFFAHFIKK